MNIDRIFKDENGYRYMDYGCGCCTSDYSLAIKDLNSYIEELNGRLEEAYTILHEMNKNA